MCSTSIICHLTRCHICVFDKFLFISSIPFLTFADDSTSEWLSYIYSQWSLTWHPPVDIFGVNVLLWDFLLALLIPKCFLNKHIFSFLWHKGCFVNLLIHQLPVLSNNSVAINLEILCLDFTLIIFCCFITLFPISNSNKIKLLVPDFQYEKVMFWKSMKWKV